MYVKHPNNICFCCCWAWWWFLVSNISSGSTFYMHSYYTMDMMMIWYGRIWWVVRVTKLKREVVVVFSTSTAAAALFSSQSVELQLESSCLSLFFTREWMNNIMALFSTTHQSSSIRHAYCKRGNALCKHTYKKEEKIYIQDLYRVCRWYVWW